ncbi:uncharacterized protein CEXT_451691 [Caerostris extrusa]|uniref:Uncharacterized protein n=1 Tax=Caerostris extrusa TaxID=172846 RepID=A0AAV4UXQ6_CAEEX|nr:uncharacterized protein CEXT_451691 [Caerostris extrusa]
MEHTHWLQNRGSEEKLLLCGLKDLKFATAQGNEESFEVFIHAFSLEENPRILTAVLGSTMSGLKSLCNIEKLPNALMGLSDSTLYVWHLLEARLVTSVYLQSSEPLIVMNSIWATIENGLVFFMAVCENEDGFPICQLLAANLATGYCQIVMTYSLKPSHESDSFSNKSIKAIYNEPFLAASCKDGAFLWTATNEYCCAALETDAEVTAMAINTNNNGTVSVVIGNATGCVNCYCVNCP